MKKTKSNQKSQQKSFTLEGFEHKILGLKISFEITEGSIRFILKTMKLVRFELKISDFFFEKRAKAQLKF